MVASRRRKLGSLVLALSLAGLAGGLACAGRTARPPLPPSAEERELALLFTGDGWGELEPCG